MSTLRGPQWPRGLGQSLAPGQWANPKAKGPMDLASSDRTAGASSSRPPLAPEPLCPDPPARAAVAPEAAHGRARAAPLQSTDS